MSLGRGRGRDLTVPAWMTQGVTEPSPAVAERSFDEPDRNEISGAQPLETTPGLAALAGYNVGSQAVQPQTHLQGGILGMGRGGGGPAMGMGRGAPAATGGGLMPTPMQINDISMGVPQAQPQFQGISGKPASESQSSWTEHTAPDGRKYYYNATTRVSTYDRPLELAVPQQQQQQQWKEYKSPQGKPYYYNAATGQSVWEMPEELKAQSQSQIPPITTTGVEPVSVSASTSNPAPAVEVEASASAMPISPPSWKEYTSPDGRPYYFNASTGTSVWEEPEELRVYRMQVNQGQGQGQTAQMQPVSLSQPQAPVQAQPVPVSVPIQAEPEPMSEGREMEREREREVEPEVEVDYRPQPTSVPKPKTVAPDIIGKTLPGQGNKVLTRDEANAEFKQLLRDKKIASSTSWEEAMLTIIHDSRYGAVKSLAERKRLFSEYAVDRVAEEKVEREESEKKKKTDFAQMMTDLKIELGIEWREAKRRLVDDPRWTGLSRREREDMYDDYMYDQEIKEKERKRQERKENIALFKDALATHTEVNVKTSWRACQELFADEPFYKALHREDRFDAFEDFMKELEKTEAERRHKEKEEKRRVERKKRDAFRELLRKKAEESKLTHRTRWRDFSSCLENEPSYMDMLGQSGSTPRDIFDSFMEDMDSVIHQVKRKLKEMMKALSIEITLDSVYEEFVQKFEDNPSFLDLNAVHVKWVFDELKEKAEMEEQKRKRRILEKFIDLLKVSAVVDGEEWSSVKDRIGENPDFVAVESEETRVKLFEKFLAVRSEKEKGKRKREEEDVKGEGEEVKEEEKEEGETESSAKKMRVYDNVSGSSGTPGAAAVGMGMELEEGEVDPVREMEEKRRSVLEKLRSKQ